MLSIKQNIHSICEQNIKIIKASSTPHDICILQHAMIQGDHFHNGYHNVYRPTAGRYLPFGYDNVQQQHEENVGSSYQAS